MGLKIAVGQYTDQFGSVQNALLSWYGANIAYGIGGSIQFAVFENEAEAARNNRKNLLTMPISAEDVLAMFSRSGIVALEISEASWDLAMENKFIPSRTIDEVTLDPQMNVFSLTDLKFQIIELEPPEVLIEAVMTNNLRSK